MQLAGATGLHPGLPKCANSFVNPTTAVAYDPSGGFSVF
jgi:hypothetical protein